jgi:hypothetical protein
VRRRTQKHRRQKSAACLKTQVEEKEKQRTSACFEVGLNRCKGKMGVAAGIEGRGTCQQEQITSLKRKIPWAEIDDYIISHPIFKVKIRCSSYVCPESSCHTYGQNVSTEYQCLYYIVSYYKNLLQVQKGLNSGMDPILLQAVDRGFRTPRRNLHQRTPHPLSSRI